MSIKDVLAQAVELDPTISLTEAELEHSDGFTTEYMLNLGLTKAQLKKLNRQGKVVKAYRPGVQGATLRWIVLKESISG